MDGSRLLGVLVTYRRPIELERTLGILAGQSRPLDELIVVDNAPSPENETLVRSSSAAGSVGYLPMPENLGFPGGLVDGMTALMADAGERDWILVLDDDDPPPSADSIRDLFGFAEDMIARDPKTAAVGLRGARFDRRRGLLNRVSTREIDDAVTVDCIAGNALPLYRVAALRDVGTFTGPLFFSHEELDLGLRLHRAGYALYAHGSRWRERRDKNARPDVLESSRLELLTPNWRSYYSLRNTIYILRRDGRGGVALRVTLGRGILKPLLHVPRAPRTALRAIALNLKACVDGWRGRLGRRVEPEISQPRPKKLASATRIERTSR